MKRVLLNKPNDTVDFENFNLKSKHIICKIKFNDGINYYYSPTKLSQDRYCLVNIAYPGGCDSNDSDDLRIWANPKTMLREFLSICPEQNSMFVFNSQVEMFKWLAEEVS